jgi:hypothetical protein
MSHSDNRARLKAELDTRTAIVARRGAITLSFSAALQAYCT